MDFDEPYRSAERPWGGEPLAFLKNHLSQLKPGTALDLGVGDGRNALYLAAQGFTVTGVDISELAIQKFLASTSGFKAIGVAQDITAFDFTQAWDNVLCNFVLHFLPGDFGPTLEKIQAATAVGGLNIISDFTQTGPLYRAGCNRWLKEGELKALYADWEILHYAEVEVKTRAKDARGENVRQIAAEIVAKKLG